MHDLLESKYPIGDEGQAKLTKIIDEIKRKGKKSKYDCLVGVSGGTDSTYCLHLAKNWGLRVLAVHLDNTWDSEIATNNIKKAVEKLDIDLKMVDVNWEEYKDLQLAFLKASVPDIEIPTDIGVYAVLYKVALEEKIPSIINGHSFRTEGTAPLSWTYMEGKYIESVYRKFGTNKKLKKFPNLKFSNLFYYVFIKRIKEYRPLEYITYDKEKAGNTLEKELGWKYYGGHHYENIYTRFIASHLLLEKFGIDKRKVSLSAQVRTGKLTREEALGKIAEAPYPKEKIMEDKNYVLTRLGLNNEEFRKILSAPIKSFLDYKTYHSWIRKLRFFIKITCKLRLIPEILYEKYAK
jgi:N-acetyl sugar amidotransferase